jgi:hypothetical protein
MATLTALHKRETHEANNAIPNRGGVRVSGVHDRSLPGRATTQHFTPNNIIDHEYRDTGIDSETEGHRHSARTPSF